MGQPLREGYRLQPRHNFKVTPPFSNTHWLRFVANRVRHARYPVRKITPGQLLPICRLAHLTSAHRVLRWIWITLKFVARHINTSCYVSLSELNPTQHKPTKNAKMVDYGFRIKLNVELSTYVMGRKHNLSGWESKNQGTRGQEFRQQRDCCE